jgi:Tfp pilus assembly protein PilZ
MLKTNSQANRRAYARIPLTMTVRCTKQGTDQSNEGVVRTISTHGLGMYTKASLEKGDRLLIHLSLLTDEDQPVEESILGEVTWGAPEGVKSRYSVGVHFSQMEKEHPKLYAYLKRLEEAVLHSDEAWK